MMIEKRPKMSGILSSKKLTLTCKQIICSVLFVLYVVACSQDKPLKISAIKDRATMPQLHATEITTVISDSGITRYRISTPLWNVYDKASQPYWEFPKGIHVERFNLEMKVDANIHSKYAKFNQNEKIWELRGKVRLVNLQGELFETEQLFWNQNQERFYSDSLINITRANSVTRGVGFESNQSMTHYQIKHFKGVFPIVENSRASAPAAVSQQNIAKPTVPAK